MFKIIIICHCLVSLLIITFVLLRKTNLSIFYENNLLYKKNFIYSKKIFDIFIYIFLILFFFSSISLSLKKINNNMHNKNILKLINSFEIIMKK
jgi:hypothetical protein